METEDSNVASRLQRWARRTPTGVAIIEPAGRVYHVTTFEELDAQTNQLARGMLRMGFEPGMRVVLAVPFSGEFIRLTFALLKAGLVPILVDPGMGRKNLVRCLQEARPDGFLAIPQAHAIRTILGSKFRDARLNITVGKRWFWGGKTLRQVSQLGRAESTLPTRVDDDDAAIIFTTGSTGPPKGVRYTHSIFNHQIDLIRTRYQIPPGGRDLACFPLFGLFDAMMGVTTVIPEMDPTRPADVDAKKLCELVTHCEIDQAFGSPALWHRVAGWAIENNQTLPSLRRVLSAGAPVPPTVLRRLRSIVAPDADIYTPYGATEALPIASIESREVLDETANASALGKGICVGSRFDQIDWRVIAIEDRPIRSIEEVRDVQLGEIGELMVAGPVVTTQYVTRLDQNALHKVRDGAHLWHRMGDVGFLDDRGRFWFCGRKSHRVCTPKQTLFTIPCESIFNQHPDVYRTALVGRGPQGAATPVLVVEPHASSRPRTREEKKRLLDDLKERGKSTSQTEEISEIVLYPRKLPVDIRHNSKIFREQLALWVARNVPQGP